MTRREMIQVLSKYRRPGSPVYDHHFPGLPAKIARKGNVRGLVGILRDAGLPAIVRQNAAGVAS